VTTLRATGVAAGAAIFSPEVPKLAECSMGGLAVVRNRSAVHLPQRAYEWPTLAPRVLDSSSLHSMSEFLSGAAAAREVRRLCEHCGHGGCSRYLAVSSVVCVVSGAAVAEAARRRRGAPRNVVDCDAGVVLADGRCIPAAAQQDHVGVHRSRRVGRLPHLPSSRDVLFV
jgi:hypothetical protein